MDLERDGYLISTDPERLDRRAIHAFIRDSYWAPGIPFELVDRSIDRSISFGLYAPGGAQAGFARVVTDGATFAYLADVFVIDEHRGKGLGVWLVETALAHPDLEHVRRVMLGTADAHSLYERFGFRPADRAIVMERFRDPKDIYETLAHRRPPG